MIVYSHRGESKYAPENTMSAFYLAALVNSDGIEADIRKTKDNKLVLIHDKTIDRTSNNSGKVCEYTLDELSSFDFGNKNYKGEKIVELSEFLKFFSGKDIKIYLEVKEDGYEELIWDILSKYDISNITLISFKYNVLEKLRLLSDNIKLGWLVYDLNSSILTDSKKIHLNQLILTSVTLDAADVKKLRNNGIEISAWGVKNKSELKRLNNLEIDAVVYDSAYDAKRILKNE